jgi:type II secretory pathway pseudopilin PulG
MPRAAVALAGTDARAADARAADARAARSTPSTRTGSRAAFRPRRLHAILVAIAIVSVWLVLVFARALGDVDRATARHQQMSDDAAALQTRLDADRRELALVQTDAFQRLQARAYGMGAANEVVFSLPADAPTPAPIVPLGATSAAADDAAPASATTPLDAWLEILFGD